MRFQPECIVFSTPEQIFSTTNPSSTDVFPQVVCLNFASCVAILDRIRKHLSFDFLFLPFAMEAIAAFKKSACYAALQSIIDAYEDDVDAKLVMTSDKIIQTCMTHGYAQDITLNVKEIGACPSNRDGEGLSFGRAHSRLSIIKASGFSFTTFKANAICMEDDPDKTFGKYTASLSASNSGYAKYDPWQVKAGCLGSTHAVHGLACALDQAARTIPNISENGKKPKQKLLLEMMRCWPLWTKGFLSE